MRSVPEGHLKIARRFNAGYTIRRNVVPEGRLNGRMSVQMNRLEGMIRRNLVNRQKLHDQA